MGIDGVSASPPIMTPSAAKGSPPSDPEITEEAEGSEKDNGAVRKLNAEGGSHFEGKGVSDIRLRIAHSISPEEAVNELVVPVRIAHSVENTGETFEVPEHGPTKAYQKFLDQYKDQYEDQYSDPVAQVDTLTVGGTIEEGDVFEITNEDESLSISVIATPVTTIAEIVTELVGMWNSTFTGIIADGQTFESETTTIASSAAITGSSGETSDVLDLEV